MRAETHHSVEPFWRWLILICGAACATLGTICIYVWIEEAPTHPAVQIGAGAAVASLLFGAFWCFRDFLSPGRYAVSLSDAGIRFGESGPWTPWSTVRELRYRPFLQRLELLDDDRQRLGAIEYQIENAAEVLRTVRERVTERTVSESDPPRRFGRRSHAIVLSLVMDLSFFAFFLTLWAIEPGRPWWGLLLPLLVVGWLHYVGRDDLRQLDLGDDALVLSTLYTRRRIPRDQIRAVELDLSADWDVKRVETAVYLEDGSLLRVTPVGSEATDVYRATRQWHQEKKSKPPRGAGAASGFHGLSAGWERIGDHARGPLIAVRFSGDYLAGSRGNGFAEAMIGFVRSVLAETNASGVIFDLTALEYVWGDAIGGLAWALYEVRNGSRAGAVVATGATARALTPLFEPKFLFGIAGLKLAGTEQEALEHVRGMLDHSR